MKKPLEFDLAAALVDEVIARRGRALVVALPIGVGKATHIANELVARAMEGELEELTIFTALSLNLPKPGQEFVRRLMGPIQERLYENVPELTYVTLRAAGKLPDHIRIHEFYYPPGSLLGNGPAQRSYTSINFTHALEVLLDMNLDLIAQMAAPVGPGEWDLGSNTDLTLPLLEHARAQGDRAPLLALQTNDRLPAMSGEACVGGEWVDLVLHDPTLFHDLLGSPSLPPGDAEYAIGLRAASLLRDGGTVQVGIGAVGEAVCWAACLRDADEDLYAQILDTLGQSPHEQETTARLGGTNTFDVGLYSSTELLSDGILGLYRRGLLRRQVFEDVAIERARANLKRPGPTLDLELLDELISLGALEPVMTQRDFDWMQRFHMFAPDVTFTPRTDGAPGFMLKDAHDEVVADLRIEHTRRVLSDRMLSLTLGGGAVVHAGFYVGSPAFYQALREFDDEDRRLVAMKGIRFTNLLYGDEELKRLSRRDARFLNQAMMITLSGSAVSDGLEDGRVVSGVGGQYEFVAMAHELFGARSILMLAATRTSRGKVHSNIIWQYGHCTIPRHLRDIVITEYGIADLRGRSDEEVIARLIEIADSRFQEELIATAKKHGKLSADYKLPGWASRNTPERLSLALESYRERDEIPRCPFGSDLTDLELDLIEALGCLEELMRKLGKKELPEIEFHGVATMAQIPDEARPYLERMGLLEPESLAELGMQRALLYALGATGIL